MKWKSSKYVQKFFDDSLLTIFSVELTAYLSMAEVIHAEVTWDQMAFVDDTALLHVRSLSHLLPWHQD